MIILQNLIIKHINRKKIDSLIIQSSQQTMSLYRNQSQQYQDNTYNSIRSNNPDRISIRNPSQRPGSYNQMMSIGQINRGNTPQRRKSLAKLNDFRKRVHEVIDAVKNQNNDVKGEIGQVVNEERSIYNLLTQNPNLLQRTVSHQSFPQQNHPTTHQNMGQTIPFRQQQRRQPLVTPFRQQKSGQVPESQYYIPNFSQVGVRDNSFPPNISHSNVMRPQSGYLQQDRVNGTVHQQYGAGYDSVNDNLQHSINRLKSSKPIQLNEDALRLIEQIERKAFEEIQKLRRQKLELMQRLNQEIRNVNDQKKRNVQLQSLVTRYASQAQRPDGGHQGDNSQYLHGQIARLQSELHRSNELNNNLRLELANRGSGVPGVEQLLLQGQAIRQQTLRLLRLKEGQSAQLVQEFQRRLASEVSQKQNALNELKALRERLGQGSRQVQRSRQVQGGQSLGFEQGFQKSTTRIKSSEIGRSVGHYQDLVSQMKRITGN